MANTSDTRYMVASWSYLKFYKTFQLMATLARVLGLPSVGTVSTVMQGQVSLADPSSTHKLKGQS